MISAAGCSAYMRQQAIDDVFAAGKVGSAKQVEVIQHVIELVQVPAQRVTIGQRRVGLVGSVEFRIKAAE